MQSKVGLLLVNLGTPDSCRPKDVYKYLIEFLTDERVIDIPWIRRQILVRGIIVPLRYRKSAKLYQSVWTNYGSPLLVHGRSVEEKLQVALGHRFNVKLAMRYRNPSIASSLNQLKQTPLEHLIVLPLFPQFASATTGSVHQKVMECVKEWSVIPKITFINNFAADPNFIKPICTIARNYNPESYDHVLFSFHGLPEKQIRSSDRSGMCMEGSCCSNLNGGNQFCYKAQCFATARAIVDELKIDQKNYSVAFQSRLGRDPWIQPYTTDILKNCASQGKKRVLVFSPSFVCDCLETTCEIGIEYQHEFKKWGGEHLQLVEGLNSHPEWIQGLRQIVLDHC